jgi:hypothetical protein
MVSRVDKRYLYLKILFWSALILESSGSSPICMKWLFMEMEGLQEAGGQLVEVSEEEGDIQAALEDVVEGGAA